MPPAKLARLRAALVVGLDEAEANDVLQWAAAVLLRAGLAEE